MTLPDYSACVTAIPFGKRLLGAVYVFRVAGVSFGQTLDALVAKWIERYEVSPEFNVIKFRTDELKVSFLAYPAFEKDAHPALERAMTIDLVTGRVRRTDYVGNINPPILHRKEAFLPAEHPLWKKFRALTEAEEAAGLYEETTTIGFRLNWGKLLKSKGLEIRGHKLVDAGGADSTPHPCPLPGRSGEGEPPTVVIERHKTAIARYELSKPTKSLLEYGLLKTGSSFFDYGCGQGTDIRGLQALGYAADGWDPVHRRETTKQSADIVNLGYVLNVIEDPVERLEALVDAFKHTQRLLVVSGLIRETVEVDAREQFADGVLTKRNTFQKFFEQHELQQFIEDALDATAVPVALGIFYVFREPTEQQDFLSARSRRAIDWTQVRARLGLGQPRRSKWEVFYEQHKELLDSFWAMVLQLARLPAPEEYPRFAELVSAAGSAKRALKLFVRRGGGELLQRAADDRRHDLLVYLALANLRRRIPFGQLSAALRLDIRTFFKNHKNALARGIELLYAAGDTGEIELACEELKIGWQDERALFVHRSLVDRLPPVLRAYVGCATSLFGDVAQVDVVKLHRSSGKVTFLVYDDFDGKPLPELRQRIKVNLRTRWVQVFDHSAEGQILYFKERLVGPDYPGRENMEKFSTKIRRMGLSEATPLPLKRDLIALLKSKGLNENLNSLRGRRSVPGEKKL